MRKLQASSQKHLEEKNLKNSKWCLGTQTPLRILGGWLDIILQDIFPKIKLYINKSRRMWTWNTPQKMKQSVSSFYK